MSGGWGPDMPRKNRLKGGFGFCGINRSEGTEYAVPEILGASHVVTFKRPLPAIMELST